MDALLVAVGAWLIVLVILLHTSSQYEIPELGPTPTVRSTCRYLKRCLRPRRRNRDRPDDE